jgi:alpha-L-fucosidase 2
MSDAKHKIWSERPARLWAEGYPVGNGRLGAMVLGDPARERVALNHDRLWRRYWAWQEKGLAGIFRAYQQLCLAEKWDEAYALLRPHVMPQGGGIYVNPFVPVGDLGIYPTHRSPAEPTEYRRTLDLDRSIVEVTYAVGGIRFRREYLASHPAGVIAVHLSANPPGAVSAEVSLYRLLERECQVSGTSRLDEIVMEGRFEEGVRFAAVARVIQRGGRLTSGLTEYVAPEGDLPAKDLEGFTFGFRDLPHPPEPRGVSTCIDSADEALVLVAMATDRVAGDDVVGHCRRVLDATPTDYPRLRDEHTRDHRRLYRRVSLSLGGEAAEDQPTDRLVDQAVATQQAGPEVFEKMFNLSRYLAIAAGRPARPDEARKTPINLQGLWNEDRRPAWDCDMHLDLNLQMCYWPLAMVHLAEMNGPLLDWLFDLLPQARAAARDIYGCEGAAYPPTCDAESIGNVCDLGMLAIGTNAWLAQMAWMPWQYNHDVEQLRTRIYPVMREIGTFFAQFLVVDSLGRLVPAPSGSPENCPLGRPWASMLSVASTFDLELIRGLFEHLQQAAEILDVDRDQRGDWNQVLEKLPLPSLSQDGRLMEWLERDYEVVDPGHRHRSHLVGICPGERISEEDTPDYNEGVRKALAHRYRSGPQGSCTLDVSWDAQIFARLYQGSDCLGKLTDLVANHAMGNLLLCLCDWREGSSLRWFDGRRVFQIEASFGALGAITEMLLQDRRGLLRLLPALPAAWPAGEITGLRARGGFQVDIRWQEGRLTQARIRSLRGGRCRVKSFTTIGEPLQLIHGDQIQRFTPTDSVVEFDTIAGETYALKPL